MCPENSEHAQREWDLSPLLISYRNRAENTQALAPLDRAPVGEWPAISLAFAEELDDAYQALRRVQSALAGFFDGLGPDYWETLTTIRDAVS